MAHGVGVAYAHRGGRRPGFGGGDDDDWHLAVFLIDRPHASPGLAGAALVGAGGGRVFDNPVAVVGLRLLVEPARGAVFVTSEVCEAFAVVTLLLAVGVAFASGLAADR